MTERIGRSLNTRGKIALASAGIVSLALPGASGTARAIVQTPPTVESRRAVSPVQDPARTTRPTFDVASVKRGGALRSTQIGFQPGRFFAVFTPLRPLIALVFSPPGTELQVIDGPSWLDADPFDIDAKTDPATSPAVMRLMARTLLEERFGLRVHVDQLEAPLFALVADPRGIRLRDAAPDDCTTERAQKTAALPVCGFGLPVISETEILLRARRVSLAQVAADLEPFAGRRLVDRTGLPTLVSFELRIVRDPAGANEPGLSATALADALQEQLGLRLVSTRGQVDILRIESVHQPDAN